MTVDGSEQVGEGEYRLTAHLKGKFPGGEADVDYRFSIRDGLISSLRIT